MFHYGGNRFRAGKMAPVALKSITDCKTQRAIAEGWQSGL